MVAPNQPTWSLAPIDAGRLNLALRGDFSADTARELERALRQQLSAAVPGSFEAIINLSDLARCDVDGRQGLLDIQRYLGRLARRTVYVAERPLFRGLGLWLCHNAPDSNARTFPSLEQARAWLASDERREDALAQRAASWIGRLRGAGREARP
ncbi:MAG: STAS domain-containing protein [Nannocystis sp.]|nr:STAS domain-containing protein [Nannocystis sp.]